MSALFKESLVFEYSKHLFTINPIDETSVQIAISTDNPISADTFHHLFSFLIEIFQLALGYFPEVTQRELTLGGTATPILGGLPLKYKSAPSFQSSLYGLVPLQNLDIESILTKWVEFRQKHAGPIDVYYVVLSETDLYAEIKLALLLQACEGLGKSTMKNIEAYPLNDKCIKEIKSRIITNLETDQTIVDLCSSNDVSMENLIMEIKNSISKFHSASLGTVLNTFFTLNDYTVRTKKIGDNLKSNDGTGIIFKTRSLNHRNYFAHLTDRNEKLDGCLAQPSIQLYLMLFRLWLIEQLSLSDMIDQGIFTKWELSMYLWLTNQNCINY